MAATNYLHGLMRPEHPTTAYLSKSDFKITRTCPTKLYCRKCCYNHLLTKVSVEWEVAALLPQVREAVDEQVANLCPSLRKIATPLSVDCRGCEFRGGNVAIKDGFRECWQDLAGVTPYILDLYHVTDAGDETAHSHSIHLINSTKNCSKVSNAGLINAPQNDQFPEIT